MAVRVIRGPVPWPRGAVASLGTAARARRATAARRGADTTEQAFGLDDPADLGAGIAAAPPSTRDGVSTGFRGSGWTRRGPAAGDPQRRGPLRRPYSAGPRRRMTGLAADLGRVTESRTTARERRRPRPAPVLAACGSPAGGAADPAQARCRGWRLPSAGCWAGRPAVDRRPANSCCRRAARRELPRPLLPPAGRAYQQPCWRRRLTLRRCGPGRPARQAAEALRRSGLGPGRDGPAADVHEFLGDRAGRDAGVGAAARSVLRRTCTSPSPMTSATSRSSRQARESSPSTRVPARTACGPQWPILA